jgi:glutamate racemase
VKIGVFDSGIGGKSVANALVKELPEHEVVFRNDKNNVPYGSRTPDETYGFVVPILDKMVHDGCEIIVVACNTVSTTLIRKLRRRYNVPLIALVPMVKPAVELTKTGVIAVCATPVTLASNRYKKLKNTEAKHVKVLEPDCSDWSYMIEHSQVDDAHVAERINSVLDQGADVIVLGCTHYHWIEDEIKALAKGRAVVLQPEAAVANRVRQVIGRWT